jgi:hypothetical protein
VELRRRVGTDSGSTAKGYSHPRDFPKDEIKFLLGSIRYQDKALLGWADAKAVFSAHELYVIAPHIVEAFNMASTDDEVAFKSNISKSGVIFSSKRYSDGVMFVKNGKLNCAFANINIRPGVSDIYEGDPRKLTAGGLSRLVTNPWQSLHTSEKGTHDNWIMIDVEEALIEKAAVERALKRHRKVLKRRKQQRLRESVEWEDWSTDTPIEVE